MSRAASPRLASRLSLAASAVALLLLAGCADMALGLPNADEAEDVTGDGSCYENTSGQCVVATEGCDPATITGSAAQRCATCEVDGGAVDICGTARVARCFDLEIGGTCQRCVTDDGEVLYDDCAAGADELSALRCEQVTYDADEGTTCQVCRDDNGSVVRESCRPNAAECVNVTRGGRACQECFTAEGELAYRECERPDLDPRVCEVYGDASARCVDCYGGADELLSHECTFGGRSDGGVAAPNQGVAYCDAIADPSGRTCERCYSLDGALVSEACTDVPAGAERCQELVYTSQTCLVCVDASGQESYTQCTNTSDGACAPGQPCAAPPPCENRYLDDGTLCRTCPSPSAGGESETRCMSGGGLVCDTVEEFSEAPPEDGFAEPDVVSSVCTVCTVDGVEEYRQCNSDGTVPPQPVCAQQTTADQQSCEVCTHPESDEEIYSSCSPNEPPPPPTCDVESGLLLRSKQGEPLYLPDSASSGGSSQSPAIVNCALCPDENGGVANAYGNCLLQHECNEVDSDSAMCSERVIVSYKPTQCQEPWEEAPGIDVLVSAMSWLLEEHGVVVYTLFDDPVAADFQGACEACDCPRGDTYRFEVSHPDAELMLGLNAGFYQ